MKKFNLDPLTLDKTTIALLDEKQLQEIMGGRSDGELLGTSTGCGTGGSNCGTGGGSSGCGSGGSSCIIGD
ncbi:MAG TPA: class I lanthipeptide [Chitinophagaceae bacterium]